MSKILLVEDDQSLREIYSIRLTAEGYEIVVAGDGEEALALAVKEHPDLILSDVMMPKISGFDMLDILRSTPETKDMKVVMMTALSSEDQRKRGESLGADRYLVKSQVGIEDVVNAVHEVIGDVAVTAPEAATTAEKTTNTSPAESVSSVETAPVTGMAPAPSVEMVQSFSVNSVPNTTPAPAEPVAVSPVPAAASVETAPMTPPQAVDMTLPQVEVPIAPVVATSVPNVGSVLPQPMTQPVAQTEQPVIQPQPVSPVQPVMPQAAGLENGPVVNPQVQP